MRILLTGGSGQLGGYLLRQLAGSDQTVTAWSGSRSGEWFGFPLEPVNLLEPALVRAAFRAARPDVVLHAAALATVTACHRDPVSARQLNADATILLTDLCAVSGARLLLVSTDLVFDGDKGDYHETDEPAPLSVYGHSKRAAELAVLTVPRNLVVRVSLLFGPPLTGRPSFFDDQVRALRQRQPITCFADEWRTPLALPTAAQALTTLLTSDVTGLLHLGGPERLSRLEMAQQLAAYLGADASVIVPASRSTVATPEPRPRDTSLNSSRWRSLFPQHPWPTFAAALAELPTPL